MSQILLYASALFAGFWLGENLQPIPMLVVFVAMGFIVYNLLRKTEGLATVPGIVAGTWSIICFVVAIISHYRTTDQTWIGEFLRDYIFN
jgi:EamA domain-containing membrane protein RarD